MMGRQSPELRQILWQIVSEAKRDDPMAPVTVISPSRYCSLSLRQELGRQGFVNVRFLEMPVLAELLGGAALAAEGRRPLTPTLQCISLRQALARATGVLQPVRHHPKTQLSLGTSFRELRRLGTAALDELAGGGGVTAEVVSLYRAQRSTVSSDWFDPEDLAAGAAEVVERGQAAALDDLGRIVFYLPRNTSPAQQSLILSLAYKGRCSLVLGTTGDPKADEPITDLARDLEPALGAAEIVAGFDSATPLPPGDVQLHVAPSTHEELRWVIRRIVAEAGSNGTPFHHMAVLYRMENPYGTLIRDELSLANIPMAGPGRDVLAETGVGRALLGLLNLSRNDFRRDEVMEWLTGCPVSPPQANAAGFSPSRWDTISRQSGIVGGLQQWEDRLETYARTTLENADRDETAESISEARAAAMRENAGAALDLRQFMAELAEAVNPPPTGSSWKSFCDWAGGLLTSYLSPTASISDPSLRERFERDREAIDRKIDDMRAADAISPAAEADEFRQVLSDSLQSTQGHLGATGQGVFVSSFATAVGMDFDVIWLVGMIEGGAPPAVRPDPLLAETPRHDASKPSRAEQRMAAERFDYLSALATAPRRNLSYPVADTSSRREAHPSRWLLEQASILANQPVHSSSLPSLAGHPWFSVTQSAEHALVGVEDAGLADELDFNLHRLAYWKRGGLNVNRHPLASQGTLARAGLLRRNRTSRRLSEYDGNVSDEVATARFAQDLGRQPISPTRLEAWATCPFRFFLSNVLRLGALEAPEDTNAISPLERGSLIHAILEKFIVQTNAAGSLPPPGRDWSEQDRNRLMEIAEAEFQAAETRGVTGMRLLWELAKQDIRDDLDTFLVEEAKLRAAAGTGQLRAEARFGLGESSPDVTDPETKLRFRGIIDRVDISADGKSVLVVDYKTGSMSPYGGLKDDPIDHGKRLQLGVYSLAAQHLVPGATQVRAAYWFTSNRAGFGFAPPDHFDISEPDTARRFRKGVSSVVEGIRAGVFPANPGDPRENGFANCRYCDFDALCPSRRDEVWELKKEDPRVAAYRELAEDVAAAEEVE